MTQTTKTFTQTNFAAKDRPAPDELQEPQITEKPIETGWTQHLRKAKVKQADLIMFTNQLSIMLDSGVVISDALDAIAEQNSKGSSVSVFPKIIYTANYGKCNTNIKYPYSNLCK